MTNKQSYHTFCRTAPDLPVFSQDWYLDAFTSEGEWDVTLVRKGDAIVASLPYYVKRKYGFRYIFMPPLVKTMGPYVIPEYRDHRKESSILEELIANLPEVDGFKQDFHHQLTNWLPFHWAGYRQTTRYTYLLDLSDLDAVYSNIKGNKRRYIRKAEEQLTVTSDLPIEEFFRVNSLTFERQGMPVPYSYDLFLRHDEALNAHNARKIFFAVDDRQRIHSVLYLIWDQHSAYLHLAGDDPDLRDSGASSLLTWAAIRYTKEQLGLDTFDFEGSMIRGIEINRRHFGARQQGYHRVWRYDSRVYEVLDRVRQGWRGEFF